MIQHSSSRMAYKLAKIPKELLDDYKSRKITSAELSEKADMNASYLRRAIKRDPIEAKGRPDKSELVRARRAFRNSLADRPAQEIAKVAHVGIRTAQRLRARKKKAVQMDFQFTDPGPEVTTLVESNVLF